MDTNGKSQEPEPTEKEMEQRRINLLEKHRDQLHDISLLLIQHNSRLERIETSLGL